MPKPDYECVRCGYQTRRKGNMHKHLYLNLKPCPSVKNRIDLTEEIKQDILKNRIHFIESGEKPQVLHINNNVNNINNNNINNVLINMSPVDKLNHLLQFQDRNLIGFGDKIEQNYKAIIDRLDNDKYKFGFEMDESKFLDVIDKSMQLNDHKDPEYMNVLFIQELNKITMYHDEQWDSYLMETGIKQIIRIIRDYYLEAYEKYMLRKILMDNHSTSAYDLNKYKLQLNEYYKFLAFFDVHPSAYQKENCDMIPDYSHDNNHHVEEYSMNIYLETKSKLTKSEINKMKRMVLDIIKKNTTFNIKNLNKSILKLAEINEEFRQTILKT